MKSPHATGDGTSNSPVARPRSGPGNTVGLERYRLISAAFQHAQCAIVDRRYLEAITVLESVLADRVGSLVYGSLGQEVTLRHTLGQLIAIAKKNVVIPRSGETGAAGGKRRAPLSPEVIDFVAGDLSRWWQERNHAVHAMAKLRCVGDLSFPERYSRLSRVALGGVRVLLQLDILDERERIHNGAGHSATWPDALKPTAYIDMALAAIGESAD